MGNCCGGDDKAKTKVKPNDSQETEGLDEETAPQKNLNKQNTKNDTQKSRNLNSNNNNNQHNNNINNLDDLSPDEDEEENEYDDDDRTTNYDNRSEISNRVPLPAGPPKRKVVLQKGDDIDEKSGKPIRPSWNSYAKVGASPSKDRNMKSRGKAQGGETMLVYESRNNKKGEEEYYLVEDNEDDSTSSTRNLNKASSPKFPAPGSASPKKPNSNNNNMDYDDHHRSPGKSSPMFPNGKNNRGAVEAFDELNPEVNPDVANHLSPKARREYEQNVDKDGKNRREGFELSQSNKEFMNSNNSSPASNQKQRTPSVDESTPESNTGFSPPKLNPGRSAVTNNNNNNGHLQISARRELPPNSPSQRGVALKRANNNNNDEDDNDEIVEEENQDNDQQRYIKTSPKRAVIATTAESSPSPKRLALNPNNNNNNNTSRGTSSVRSNSSSRDERRSASAAAMERLSRPRTYKNNNTTTTTSSSNTDEKGLRRGSAGSAATRTTTTSRGRHSSASRLRNARPPPAEAYLRMPRHYRHTNPDDGTTSVSTEPTYPPPFTTPFAVSSGATERSRLYDIPRRADPNADLSPRERVERGRAMEARMALLPPGEARRRGMLSDVTYQTTGSVRAASTTSSNERTGRIRSSSRNNGNKSSNRDRQLRTSSSSSPARRNKNAPPPPPPSSSSLSAPIQIQLSSEGVNAIATRVADIMLDKQQHQNPKYNQTAPAPYEKEIIVAKPRVHQTTKHLGQPIRMPSPKRVVVRPGDPEYLRMSGGGVECEHDNDSSSLTPFRNNGTRPFPHSEVNEPPNLWMSKEKSQFRNNDERK